MVDFEKVITNACKKQEANIKKPEIRMCVYNACWDALNKIASNPTSQKIEILPEMHGKLSEAIIKVELGYIANDIYGDIPISTTPPPDFTENRYLKNKKYWRTFAVSLLGFGIFCILIWVVYTFAISYFFKTYTSEAFNINKNSEEVENKNRSYLTILDSSSLEALVNENRGRVKIIVENNKSLIRIALTSQTDEIGTTVSPVLIKLQKGVIKQSANKMVTVELRAKSDSSSPIPFLLNCKFSETNDCGNKAFLVNNRLEKFVFSLSIPEKPDVYLAISPGINQINSITKKNNTLDIDYIRLYSHNLKS